MNIKFDITKHKDDIYQISGTIDDQIYLVLGTKMAAVIDTGIGLGDLKAEIRQITDLPLLIINTHGHPDHAGGNGQFDETIYLHPADNAIYNKMCTSAYRKNDLLAANGEKGIDLFPYMIEGVPLTKALFDKQVFDLGDRTLTIHETPSHTPGCVVVYDSKSKSLFAGDVLTMTPTWLYLDHSLTVSHYLNSMNKLRELDLNVSIVYPGHLPVPVPYSTIDKKILCAISIIGNPEIGSYVQTFAGEGFMYDFDGATIIYDKKKI